jgi:predicted PurR-regulated permease PerM
VSKPDRTPAAVGRTGMPPWLPRLLGTIVGIVVVLFATYHILRRLRGLLILVVISFFLSIALEPGVNYLSRRWKWRRGLATGVIFIILLLVVGLFIGLMAPLVVDQVARFVDNLPRYVDEISEFAARFGVEFSSERLQEALTDVDSDLQRVATDVAGSLFGVGTALLNTIFQLLAIGLFTFYMTADGPRLRRTVLSVLPEARQREVLRMMDVAIDKTGGYFYSRALLAGISASVSWAVFTIIGVPYALALALWFGLISQFVPVVGTYIGGAIPLLVALIESPARAIAVLVFVLVYQGIENYLLAPKVTARTMSLHPALAFGSALAGGTLMGVPGALMALPTAATIQAFASTYLNRHAVVESPLTQETGKGKGKDGPAQVAAEVPADPAEDSTPA